jgi:hypothetical protein
LNYLIRETAMSRPWASAILFSLAIACWVAGGASGQEKEARAEEGNKTVVVPVKGGAGKELAGLLSKQFAGQAEVGFLPERNVLVISGKPAVLPDVVKTVMQFDRAPRGVAVEVLIVDLPPQDNPPEDGEFTDSAGKVTAKLETLRKAGKVSAIKRVQLTALENQQSSVRVGESRPFTVGTTVGRGGVAVGTVTYRDLGLQVRVTPRLSSEGRVTLEFDLEEARAVVAEDGPVIGQDEKGQPIRATSFPTDTVHGRLVMQDDRMVLAKSLKTTTRAGEARTLVLVTATPLGGR